MILLHCNHCQDIIKLTEKPKQCECGGCTSAIIGKNEVGPIYSYSGDARLWEVDDTDVKYSTVFLVCISDIVESGKDKYKNVIKLGKINKDIEKVT